MKKLYEKLLRKEALLSVIGLGYAGLPLAIAFSKKLRVTGYDSNPGKIEVYRLGIDPTGEVGNEAVKNSAVNFSENPASLRAASFHIVAVPTPVRRDHTPDLSPIENASRTLGKHLTKGSVVVYESTVYPGVTEGVCVELLEAESGLRCGRDFFVGYSPERINPGDRVHRLENIVKIVSGMDSDTLETIAAVYSLVIDAGVYRAPSIKVAEAAKVIENSQRDVNIAFMNELSMMFHRMEIDTEEVLKAAGTKWNFLPFRPGLVGGHCIGVDPHYLTYRAETLGYHSAIIAAGRRVNDDMGKFIVNHTIKKLIRRSLNVRGGGTNVAILGLTFKENCPDIRNTKVMDIYHELTEYGIVPVIADPVADAEEAKAVYGVTLSAIDDISGMDAVIVAVAHSEFSCLSVARLAQFFDPAHSSKILIDVKGIFDKDEMIAAGFDYWRL